MTARWRQCLAGAGIALIAAIELFLLVPTTIYLGNRDEFREPLSAILATYLLPAGTFVAVAAVLAAMLPAAACRRLQTLAAAFCLLVWIQSSLLVWHYGLFDGRSIDWQYGQWRGWLDGAIWIGVMLAVDEWRQWGRFVVRGAIAVCVLQVVLLGVTLALPARQIGGDAMREVTDPAVVLGRFSAQRNVLHILADGFQGDIFADLLAGQAGEKGVAEKLDGFTFYRDQMGAFPYTHLAVPALVSGQLYDNQQPLPRFLSGAMGASSIFNAARKSGYAVEVAVPEGTLTTLYGFARDAQGIDISGRRKGAAWRNTRDEALLLGDLTLFRVAPHFVKRFVYNDQSWLLQSLFGFASIPGEAYFSHNQLLRDIAGSVSAGSPKPVYRMIHLMLLHSPAVASMSCRYAGRVLPQNRVNVQTQAHCSLDAMLTLLSAMRSAGVYDQTTIVITGDHGAWVAPAAYATDSRLIRRANDVGIAANYIGHANPLLLVKPPHAHGMLRVSDAPTWIVDVPGIIAKSAGISGSFPGALGATASDRRERRFYDYEYTKREWDADYLPDMHEYIVSGPVADAGNWRRGTTLRAPAAEGSAR